MCARASLSILGRSATRDYRGRTPRDVAGELGASVALTGSLQTSGDTAKLTMELIDPDDGAGYRSLLAEWDILVGEDNPIPRTNVAPVVAAPAEASLYAFAYTMPGATPSPTFIVAGAGEMRDRGQGAEGIVRHGETTPEAMREKARFVMGIMQERMRGLGCDWARATAIDVYTAEAQPFGRRAAAAIVRARVDLGTARVPGDR